MEAKQNDKFTRLLNKDFSRLDKLTLSSEYLHKVSEISEYNDLIASYYLRMSEESGMIEKDLYARIADNVSKCHKLFFSDYYSLLQTKDVISIPTCKNRFCANCQKLLQQKRVNSFKPFIDSALKEGYNLYHVVFTVKNPLASGLKLEYAAMQKAFALLMRYLSGNVSLCGADLRQWGFYAAVRAIEITYNNKGEFHPHYHCVMAFRNAPFDDKIKENSFSWHGGRLTRYFSENEILLQKLWKICVDISRCKVRYSERTSKLYPGVKLSKKRLLCLLESMDRGYSVVADRLTENNVYEVFKYACKFTSDENRLMSYEQFRVLYKLLNGKRCVQCFGGWYNRAMEDELNEITNDDVKFTYNEIRQWLRSLDTPNFTSDSPKQLAVDIDHYGLRVIYRAKIREHLDELMTKINNDGQMSMEEFFGIVKL